MDNNTNAVILASLSFDILAFHGTNTIILRITRKRTSVLWNFGIVPSYYKMLIYFACVLLTFLVLSQNSAFDNSAAKFRFISQKRVKCCCRWSSFLSQFDIYNTKLLSVKRLETQTMSIVTLNLPKCFWKMWINCGNNFLFHLPHHSHSPRPVQGIFLCFWST